MIDWHTICKNLRRRGLSLAQAATLAGIPATHIQGIWTGKAEEPVFSAGVKLLDLHLDMFPELHHTILET